MIAHLALLLAAASAAPALALSPAPSAPRVAAGDLEARLAEAGRDKDKLFEVAQWCETNGKEDEARKIYETVIELDADHEGARRGLRHHRYDDRWFTSFVALSKYRRAEEARKAEQGLVRFRDGWAPETDVPFLRMGWIQDGDKWLSEGARKKHEEEAKLVGEGWQQQDLVWVEPADFDKWRAGLWKCGDEWLQTPEAEAYHAAIENRWVFPSEKFIVESTCDRKSVEWAGWWADQVYADCARALGLQPATKPTLVVLNGIPQYNTFAVGDPNVGHPPTETDGTSSCHYAYFAEGWFGDVNGSPEFRGCGVAYWDTQDASLAAYGQHAIRHAAAQSYIEACDPSWDAVSRWIESPSGGLFPPAPFWAEKRVPRWFRYGVASYAERYFQDATVGDEGNPWWARDWALENLRRNEGLRDLDEIFAFQLDVNQPEDGGKLIAETGLLVSFILDGACKPVEKAHAELVRVLASGEDTQEAALALQEALKKNEKKLLRYAGM